ncbi:hypothetical protein [Burkholderia sp. L27(2015)]|uniref:hypothetical protein n=1 Tax=Burkholderia sp. L27(2015) TaxID=1641858 RepID=UPI00131D2478|nr:hypothetical protein [Burkholderia sp. L27(2015)]
MNRMETIQRIFEDVEAERCARRERDGGVLLQRDGDNRIAEIAKLAGDAWGGGDFREQMVKVAAAAIEAIEQSDIEAAQFDEFNSSLRG